MSVSRPPPATSRDHALWQQCWRDRHIDFHQTTPNPLLHRTTAGLEADRRGRLLTEKESCRTTLPGVYAGGDAVTGAATVILAMGAGREAAAEIDEDLRKKSSH